jgi:hypothetical protein
MMLLKALIKIGTSHRATSNLVSTSESFVMDESTFHSAIHHNKVSNSDPTP